MAADSMQGSQPSRTDGRALDIYVVDTGWNEKAKAILEEHLELFESFLAGHRVFVLSREQSKGILKQNIQLIGKDPLLVIVDSDARVEKHAHGYGFRLCLGTMKLNRIRQNLSTILQIICDQRFAGTQMIKRVRQEAHREGFAGLMEIIGEVVRPEG